MEKGEIVIAVKAYEAGYKQACEDLVRAFMRSNKKVFESAMVEAIKTVDDSLTQAKGKYFDALNKGKISI